MHCSCRRARSAQLGAEDALPRAERHRRPRHRLGTALDRNTALETLGLLGNEMTDTGRVALARFVGSGLPTPGARDEYQRRGAAKPAMRMSASHRQEAQLPSKASVARASSPSSGPFSTPRGRPAWMPCHVRTRDVLGDAGHWTTLRRRRIALRQRVRRVLHRHAAPGTAAGASCAPPLRRQCAAMTTAACAPPRLLRQRASAARLVANATCTTLLPKRRRRAIQHPT